MSDTITLVGNVVGDLEERTTRGGDTVAAFRLAAGDRRFDRDQGRWVDVHTNFYAVSVFGELGTHALASLRKGQRIVLTGRLRLREWETDAKRGVSADVTASALGHDLRWGTSTFAQARGADDAGPSSPNDVASNPTTAADEWAVPGASPGEDEARAGGLAPTSTVGAAPVGAATPF